MNEAVCLLEDGKMSVNLTQFEKTIDHNRGVIGKSFNMSDTSHFKPPKMTQKMSYKKEVSQKKREWN